MEMESVSDLIITHRMCICSVTMHQLKIKLESCETSSALRADWVGSKGTFKSIVVPLGAKAPNVEARETQQGL
jgi:hypothetical protein